jgi:hypothetical protein
LSAIISHYFMTKFRQRVSLRFGQNAMTEERPQRGSSGENGARPDACLAKRSSRPLVFDAAHNQFLKFKRRRFLVLCRAKVFVSQLGDRAFAACAINATKLSLALSESASRDLGVSRAQRAHDLLAARLEARIVNAV